MALDEAVRAFRAIERRALELADPGGRGQTAILESVGVQGLALLKSEFATGTSADGDAFTPTKRGRAALVSNKLPYAFEWRVDRGVIRFVGRVKREWLLAHQLGHVFPARSVAANSQYLNFNSKGKLVAERRIFRKDGTQRRGSFQRYAAEHRIRERTLPERHIVPAGPDLPAPWRAAVNAGAAIAVTQRLEGLV